MAQKPSIPKGTRDFGPVEMEKRNYIFSTISKVFKKYGYQQIETPAMENLSTLMGKYGEEGDKLLFKILNSGEFMHDDVKAQISELSSGQLTSKISEKGLRYDLTVPFARYVVQHRNEISFPFKRYQIQPVWRADRPQKGRYREFFQCDADVVGSTSLLNEVELVNLVDDVFSALKINVTVKINNRKILAGIAEYIGAPDKIIDITVAIDKLDKIGLDKVNEELVANGLSQEQVDKLQPVLALEGSNAEKLNSIATVLKDSEIGSLGVKEVMEVLRYLEPLEIKSKIELDLTLARGLNYYTGAIFEVKANDVAIGSICGGGRYDNLTGIFGLKDVSGVGISFGADRIYDVLNQLELYPKSTNLSTEILFVNFGERESLYCLGLLKHLHALDIKAELYPDLAKMKKQMTYADKKGIPFVALVGEDEMTNGLIKLKDMVTGEQAEVTLNEIVAALKSE